MLERPLFHPILHAADLISTRLRRALAECGLQPRQARILKAIAEHEPVAQASLAKAFDVAPPSITVMLQRLERDGWICRHDSGRDFRTSVKLTDKGRNVLPAIMQAWARVDADLSDAIGDKEANRFSRAALALRNSLGAAAPHDHLKETGKGEP